MVLALTTTMAGCSQSDDAGQNEPSNSGGGVAPTATSNDGDSADAAPGGSGAATAAVVLDGTTYQFEGGPSSCGEVTGGLIAALPLTQIDGAPAPDGAGMFDMTLYPEGLEDESQISVKLPDGRFGAGYNEVGMEWPAITVERDGLMVTGRQSLATHTGEEHAATVEVNCR